MKRTESRLEVRQNKDSVKLIVGLGNPGRAYKYSRHNMGFLAIDRLTKRWDIKIRRDVTTSAYLGEGRLIDIGLVVLAKPICFMNLSGNSISLLLKKYSLNIERDMLVICDDLDLEWGQIRLKPSGGSAGHKGIKSIIDILKRSDFARLRIGIGRPSTSKRLSCAQRREMVTDYVLSVMTRQERSRLQECLDSVVDCCQAWAVSGINKAMSKFN